MPRKTKLTGILLGAMASTVAFQPVWGQGDALTTLYGKGVHQYFAGDYTGAEATLNEVLAGGSQDPRVHYFLGLSKFAQGRTSEAEMDYTTGAQAEVSGSLVVDIGDALQRIQGYTRTPIEEARLDARLQAEQMRAAMEQQSLESGEVPEPPVENQPMPQEPSEEATQTDLFEGEGLSSEEVVEDEEQPTPPSTEATTDPFGDDAPSTEPAEPPAAGGDASDPFNPSEAPAEGDDPFDGGADPFSDPAPAGDDEIDDPFGGF